MGHVASNSELHSAVSCSARRSRKGWIVSRISSMGWKTSALEEAR